LCRAPAPAGRSFPSWEAFEAHLEAWAREVADVRLPKVATEMALHVLAYNLTRVINIIGVQPLVAMRRA
jgi:hypothetical protein